MLLKDLGKLFDVGIRNIDTRSDALTRLVRAGDRFGWSVIECDGLYRMDAASSSGAPNYGVVDAL